MGYLGKQSQGQVLPDYAEWQKGLAQRGTPVAAGRCNTGAVLRDGQGDSVKLLKRGWRRLLGTLANRRNERELAAELAFHIEMQVEDNLRAGMSGAEAIRAAHLKFGAMESLKESYRDHRGFPLADALLTDLRYALRGWRK